MLWEALRLREGGEGDPFPALRDVGWPSTVLFLVLCVACLLVRLPEAAPQKHMRRLAVLTLLIWFLGGAYYNWTPLSLQIPQILPFAPTRGLWLPQVLVFAALGSCALHATPKIGAFGTVAAVAFLMAIPFNAKNPKQGCALMVLLLIFAAVWAVACSRWFGIITASTWPRFSLLLGAVRTSVAECILLPSFLIFVLVVFGVSVKSRWSAYKTLWATGVMGDNRMTARWIGVAEYLNLHTPADAKVLAMCWARDGYSRHDYRSLPANERSPAPDDLVADGAIRSRSGRASPVPVLDEKYFRSYQSHLDVRERWRVLTDLGHAWQTHDATEVQNLMKRIGGKVDYIVVPTSEADWVNHQVSYERTATVDKYTILRCLD